MNAQAAIAQPGHNGPPQDDPIDEAVAPYADVIAESENWLDGEAVESEQQMEAVDALIKEMRTATSELGKAKKEATDPLHKAWKAEIARWKPTEDDFERIKKGLTALVAPYKKKLHEQREAEKRAAYEAAEKARREAEEKEREAQQSDIDAQRDAAAAKQEAYEAQKAAEEQSRQKVKGMRKVTRYSVDDYKAAINWIARNDKGAMAEFVDEYVRRNHKSTAILGVRVWEEREAY